MNQPQPRNEFLFGKLVDIQVVNKFPIFYVVHKISSMNPILSQTNPYYWHVYPWVPHVFRFLQIFWLKLCMCLSSPPCVLLILQNSALLILQHKIYWRRIQTRNMKPKEALQFTSTCTQYQLILRKTHKLNSSWYCGHLPLPITFAYSYRVQFVWDT